MLEVVEEACGVGGVVDGSFELDGELSGEVGGGGALAEDEGEGALDLLLLLEVHVGPPAAVDEVFEGLFHGVEDFFVVLGAVLLGGGEEFLGVDGDGAAEFLTACREETTEYQHYGEQFSHNKHCKYTNKNRYGGIIFRRGTVGGR